MLPLEFPRKKILQNSLKNKINDKNIMTHYILKLTNLNKVLNNTSNIHTYLVSFKKLSKF